LAWSTAALAVIVVSCGGIAMPEVASATRPATHRSADGSGRDEAERPRMAAAEARVADANGDPTVGFDGWEAGRSDVNAEAGIVSGRRGRPRDRRLSTEAEAVMLSDGSSDASCDCRNVPHVRRGFPVECRAVAATCHRPRARAISRTAPIAGRWVRNGSHTFGHVRQLHEPMRRPAPSVRCGLRTAILRHSMQRSAARSLSRHLLRRYLREPGDELRALRGMRKSCALPQATGVCESGACTGAIGRCAPGWGDCAVAPGCETRLDSPAHAGLAATRPAPSPRRRRPAESPWGATRPLPTRIRKLQRAELRLRDFHRRRRIDLHPEVRRNDHAGPVRSLLCKRRHRTRRIVFRGRRFNQAFDFDPTGCGRRANADRLVRRVRDQIQLRRYLRLEPVFSVATKRIPSSGSLPGPDGSIVAARLHQGADRFGSGPVKGGFSSSSVRRCIKWAYVLAGSTLGTPRPSSRR